MAVPSSVHTTLVVTTLIAAIFHLLYRRLRGDEFLRWWSWAWMAYALSMFAGQAAFRHSGFSPLWFVSGWLHAALLLRGALVVRDQAWPGWLSWPGTLALAAGLGLGNYFWTRATKTELLAIGLRAFLFGSVYMISAYG